MTKTLYLFAGSVWAAAAELAVTELGYKEDDITFKSINLVEGENFMPSFLKINPAGTLPTLECDGQVYKMTAKVTSALIKGAPIKVKAGTTVIETIHDKKYDPNFSMLSMCNDTELTVKSTGLLMMFISNRILLESGFIGGELPGEDDFHVAAWLTRIAATTGAKSVDDPLTSMEDAYGALVPSKVTAYWGVWIAKPSWKKVYAYVLH
ncbi:GST N-terminal domain-containing protein [Mycena venus]|uniref:GST N-terminal domain-containing protein n=1 Tax=Mycena venus TaxID=2733690 RepID=A0A8H7CJE3_9AGAR|nr:GST N-terminal domain-containing protein [Mycena venus]